jgi:DNA repair photolyase
MQELPRGVDSVTQIIYQPKGRAGEYASWAANLYKGCSHGCTYCFSPLATHTDRQQFHAEVTPRPNIREKFLKDCKELKGSGISVLFSFTCDPYTPLDSELRLTRWGIQQLHDHGMYVQILTKGKDATRDMDLMGPNDAFACTLTFIDPLDSVKWEPNAALPHQRMSALMEMHRRGIPTWASMEPCIDPKQTLELIERTLGYVDLYKLGTLNYVKNDTDWKRFARDAVNLCERAGVKYLLKKDLEKYL